MYDTATPTYDLPYPRNLVNAVLQDPDHAPESTEQAVCLSHIILYLAYRKDPALAEQLEAYYTENIDMNWSQNGIQKMLAYLRRPTFQTLYTDGIMAWCQEQNEITRNATARQAYEEGYQAGLSNRPPASFDTTPLDELPIDALNLSARAYNALYRFGNVKTVGELILLTPDDIARLRNIGLASTREIIGKLADHGLRLRES